MTKKPTTGESVRRAPHAGQPPLAPRTGRTNTLGMNSQQLDAIYAQLDAPGTSPSHKRQSSRLEFRQPSIGVDIIQPGGGQTHINVACRNLSRTGLGFLHSSYVHVGTRVVLTLDHQSAAPVRVPAKVMRCRHVTKTVHDVGVMFDEPINPRDFMALDPLDQAFTCEVVDPAQLKGTLMIVAEYEIEQSCVRSMLGDTSLDFFCVSTIAQALEKARKGVGLVICDDTFEVGSGVEFVQSARKAGLRCPIILMSADTSEEGLSRIRGAAANAFLAKPLEQSILLRAVAEFLLVSGEKSETANPVSSTLPTDSPMLGLSDLYVEDLGKVAEQLEAMVAKNDIVGVRRTALRVGGPAASQ
jgi:CheY-like chemotaxis protein